MEIMDGFGFALKSIHQGLNFVRIRISSEVNFFFAVVERLGE